MDDIDMAMDTAELLREQAQERQRAEVERALHVPPLTPDDTPDGVTASPGWSDRIESIPFLEFGSDAWRERRRSTIGSSDVPAILGLSPFTTPVEVYEQKATGIIDDKPWLAKYAEFGTWFEGWIIQWLNRRGRGIIAGPAIGTIRSRRDPLLICNVDGIDSDGVICEIKTASSIPELLPAHYYAQVQQQLWVTELSVAHVYVFAHRVPRPDMVDIMARVTRASDRTALAQWLLDSGMLAKFVVLADESWQAAMMERVGDFWSGVLAGEPPTLERMGDQYSRDERLRDLVRLYIAGERTLREVQRDASVYASMLPQWPKRILWAGWPFWLTWVESKSGNGKGHWRVKK